MTTLTIATKTIEEHELIAADFYIQAVASAVEEAGLEIVNYGTEVKLKFPDVKLSRIYASKQDLYEENTKLSLEINRLKFELRLAEEKYEIARNEGHFFSKEEK